jgi:hypothetical protein
MGKCFHAEHCVPVSPSVNHGRHHIVTSILTNSSKAQAASLSLPSDPLTALFLHKFLDDGLRSVKLPSSVQQFPAL